MLCSMTVLEYRAREGETEREGGEKENGAKKARGLRKKQR